MHKVKELILEKLDHLETLSEPVLQEVLDFVSFLEWQLNKNDRIDLTDNKKQKSLETTEDTASFLWEISANFAEGLSDEDLDFLPRDGAENHDRYLYNK